MTPDEAARYAKVHVKTVHEWITTGELVYGGSGRTIRLKASAIDRFLLNRAENSRARLCSPVEQRADEIVSSIRREV